MLLHHVYGFRVLREAESIAAGGRPKVYGDDNREWASHPGSDFHPLPDRETASVWSLCKHLLTHKYKRFCSLFWILMA